MKRNLFIAAAISSLPLVFTACGGGGGGGTTVTAPNPVATPTPILTPTPTATATATPAPTAVPLQNTSYGNAKLSGWIPTDNPDDVVGSNVIAYGDFHRNGQQMMFVAKDTYDLALPINQATNGILSFYSRDPSTHKWVKDTTLLPSTVVGCIHSRKVLVADFNGDKAPDLFIACHGYDKSPFPGEKSMVLLSQPNGAYVAERMANTHFTHGATAVDMNRDGKIDVVEANGDSNADTVLINDGSGHFSENQSLLPASALVNRNYSVEAIDLNGDGSTDLIFGGDINSGASIGTYILYSSPTTGVSLATAQVLPTDGASDQALDFYLNGSNLFLLKTNTTPSNDQYAKTVVQKITLPTLTSSVVYNQLTGDRWAQWSNYDKKWTAWFMPVNGKLVSPMIGNSMSLSIQ